jgi:hypothetical protein
MFIRVIAKEEVDTNEMSGPTESKAAMNSTKRLARIAGLLYLLVGIFGGFAQGFVYPKVYAAGDATATIGNVIANSDLMRIAIVANLFQATIFLFLALVLYQLLRHVNRSVASTMVILVAIAEIWIVGYLLFVGVKSSNLEKSSPATVATA